MQSDSRMKIKQTAAQGDQITPLHTSGTHLVWTRQHCVVYKLITLTILGLSTRLFAKRR